MGPAARSRVSSNKEVPAEFSVHHKASCAFSPFTPLPPPLKPAVAKSIPQTRYSKSTSVAEGERAGRAWLREGLFRVSGKASCRDPSDEGTSGRTSLSPQKAAALKVGQELAAFMSRLPRKRPQIWGCLGPHGLKCTTLFLCAGIGETPLGYHWLALYGRCVPA